MKPFYEQIPLSASKTYIIREFKVGELTYPLHHHPYFEINWILSGSGERIVGQKITAFKNNDLTLIGPNLPHQFRGSKIEGEERSGYHSIILQFHPGVFGEEFIAREETAAIKNLLERAKRGLVFGDALKKDAAGILSKLLHADSFEGILLFLQLLNLFANTDNFHYLSGFKWEEPPAGKGQELTDRIFHYIFENYTGDLQLEELADLAGISKSAFSHYFKKRTGKTFSVFLNELRISHANHLLRESEKNIAEVCYASGFNNLAYFNRVFKKSHSFSPRDYRKKYGNLNKEL